MSLIQASGHAIVKGPIVLNAHKEPTKPALRTLRDLGRTLGSKLMYDTGDDGSLLCSVTCRDGTSRTFVMVICRDGALRINFTHLDVSREVAVNLKSDAEIARLRGLIMCLTTPSVDGRVISDDLQKAVI